MTFNSVVFLFCFLPLALALHTFAPAPAKNAVLLCESVVFFCWGGVQYLPLALVLVAVHYAAGLVLARPNAAKAVRRTVLVLAVVLSAAVLGWFKYHAFLAGLLKSIAGGVFGGLTLKAALPLGISYYTFKLIGYTADVYTGKTEAERNPIDFAAYVLTFPQLTIGPIIPYRAMREALHDPARRCTVAKAERGAELFVFGLAKKVILADGIGALWQGIIGAGGVGLANASTPLAWLGIVAYSFQLYFDFAGFSEMSNGINAMLGFECAPNFDYPYISASVTEFWRRWHISLSTWFRDYIYIPLGGNRKGLPRQLFNMFVVWALTGIWHGSEWNFIAWGLYYFLLLTLEKSFLLPHLKKGRVWPHVYTLFCVVIGWALFTANAAGAPLGLLLGRMFVPHGGVSALYFLRDYGVTLALCGVFSTPLPAKLWERLRAYKAARLVLFGAMMVLCLAFVVGASSQTALYANF